MTMADTTDSLIIDGGIDRYRVFDARQVQRQREPEYEDIFDIHKG